MIYDSPESGIILDTTSVSLSLEVGAGLSSLGASGSLEYRTGRVCA